jgi:putative acetyltransferase
MMMSAELKIRESVEGDFSGIESLYPQAFPDEDLLPLVRDLLSAPDVAITFVGTVGSQITGHAIFTKCRILENEIKAALLGPLAVAPAWQGQGIGSAMVRAGFSRLKEEGVDVVLVLGDPAYYSRFGFAPETLVEPPFRLPDEWQGAWQSLYMDGKQLSRSGKLSVPPQWQKRALWSP